MGAHTTYDDLGPGLHLLREAEPIKRAGSMAVNLRADLCATLPQAQAALAERSALPPVDAPTLSTLQVLARRLARAERMVARTRERAVLDVGHRLASANAGLAVHPTTIRDRAESVRAARAVVTEAEQSLADHAAAAEAARARATADAAQAVLDAAEAGPRREAERLDRIRMSLRVRRSKAVGLVVAAFGVGLVLLGLGITLWAALLPALAASLVALRYLQPVEQDDDDDAQGRSEVSSLLSQMSASADERFSGRTNPELGQEMTLLEARRDRAVEDLRVAERGWHELAGDDVDISELEAVVQRFDPQHEDARLLAGETVGVRTAEVVLHRFQQRWLAFWRELGLEAPIAEKGEEAVRDLEARVSRPLVLVGPATALGVELSRAAPAAAVVVLDGAADQPDNLS
ncbi:MAG: hypothetical protein ABIY48_06930 [Acidimicrobiales bacterium]